MLDLDVNHLLWLSDTTEICQSIEEFQATLDYSNESAILSVIDFFGRIFNTLKTSMTKFMKSVKRGELKKYIEDHSATVNAIDKMNIDNPALSINIDLPSGMQVTHTEAIKFLSDVIAKLDLKATLTQIKSTLTQFCVLMQRQQDVTVQVGQFAATMNSKKAFVESSIKSMEEKFSGGTVTEKSFKSEFKSVGEFVQTKQAILAAEEELDDVQAISKLTDELTEIITDIEVNKDTMIIASAAKSLSDSAATLAKAIDLFGMAIMNLMSLSHNYTLIYNKIAQKV